MANQQNTQGSNSQQSNQQAAAQSDQQDRPGGQPAPSGGEGPEQSRLTAVNGVWFVTGFLEVLLGFRLVLKLFGANPASGFVDFVYGVTSIFVAPFRNIFSTPAAEGDVVQSVFEPGTLIAMIVYALVAWGIVKLMNLDRSEPVQ